MIDIFWSLGSCCVPVRRVAVVFLFAGGCRVDKPSVERVGFIDSLAICFSFDEISLFPHRFRLRTL